MKFKSDIIKRDPDLIIIPKFYLKHLLYDDYLAKSKEKIFDYVQYKQLALQQ
jgi:hypothetical protein